MEIKIRRQNSRLVLWVWHRSVGAVYPHTVERIDGLLHIGGSVPDAPNLVQLAKAIKAHWGPVSGIVGTTHGRD